VSISYQSDTKRAMALLLGVGIAQARVLTTPEPSVWIKNLGDNGIELELTTWIHDAEQGQSPLRSSILVDVLRAFREGGIDIPYPQRELRIVAGSLAAQAMVPIENEPQK
jgi:small-conductance mechanosensitive channel